MGVPTVTAARILKGQLKGQTGEESLLEMDKFPFVALSKVCPTVCVCVCVCVTLINTVALDPNPRALTLDPQGPHIQQYTQGQGAIKS